MNGVDGIALAHGLGYYEDALVGGFLQSFVDVVDAQLLVVDIAVHALPDHAQSLLDGFFEGAADGHHLAHRFHARTQLAVYAAKLAQVPTGYLAHHIIERRLEESARCFRHGVFQFEQAVAQTELGSHKSQRIAGGLRRQSRRTAQTGVHLDDAIVFRVGVEGILHVTLAHNADMAHNADAELAKLVVLAVCQGLRRRYHDAFARMYAQRVEVLHVTYGNAVVKTVAHHLIFNFLPAFQALLNEHLGRKGESLFCQTVELGLVVAKSRTEAAQRIGRADDDGVAQLARCGTGLLYVFAGFALNRLDVYFLQLLDEELAVLSIHDGLHRRAEHLDAITFQHAALVELHAAVERRLAAKGQHDALRTLFLDDLFDEERRDGQEVDLIGHALARLHRGYVGVDEYRLDAFFFQGFQRLRTGIVELAGLAYFQSSRTEKQNFLYFFFFHSLPFRDGCVFSE